MPLVDKLLELQSKIQDQFPEYASLVREARQSLINQEVTIGTLTNHLEIAHKALHQYEDKNFWIRVPPYSLAAADKGAIARQALQDINVNDTDNA